MNEAPDATEVEGTLEDLALELAEKTEEEGSDRASITFDGYPEDHELYGYKVTVTVEAEYEDVPEGEEEAAG